MSSARAAASVSALFSACLERRPLPLLALLLLHPLEHPGLELRALPPHAFDLVQQGGVLLVLLDRGELLLETPLLVTQRAGFALEFAALLLRFQHTGLRLFEPLARLHDPVFELPSLLREARQDLPHAGRLLVEVLKRPEPIDLFAHRLSP